MSTLKVNNIEQVGNTNLPQNLLPVTASAWVNFNGTGVVFIRDSYNVSSITDNGVGNYNINFSSPMSSTDYSPMVSSRENSLDGFSDSGISANFLQVFGKTAEGVSVDRSIIAVSVFGGQS